MKSKISRVLDEIKSGMSEILDKIYRIIKEKDYSKSKSWTDELRDLAPIDKVENFETYEQTLNWAFQNGRVKNIALSGPYGSGKSSIIETFLKKHREIKETSIRVSLATFEVEHTLEKEENKQEELPNRKIKISERDVEKAIIKQLFYKVDSRKIPQSRYRKLHRRRSCEFIIPTGFLLLLFAMIAAIIKPTLYSNYFFVVDKLLVPVVFKNPVLRLVEVLIYVAVLTFGIVLIYGRAMVKMRIKEVKLLSNATMCDNTDDLVNIFDKDLDEIMYFFEMTKYKTVFFEDLDRLETPEIFIHLHELNYLLNNDDSIGRKPIRFVYAVKDNIFVAEDRTKFFDLIIPVIPIINSTNSGEMLLEKLGAAGQIGTRYNITKDFIFDMEPFISDMRTLNNIYNEFLAYKKMLGEGQKLNLKDEKIFAMMVFKNTHPSEFYDIQKGRGSITELLAQRKLVIEREDKILQDKIDELENVLRTKSDKTCSSVIELKWAMLCRIMDGVNQFVRFESNTSYQMLEISELMKDDYDMNKLLADEYNSIYYRESGSGRYETKLVTPEHFQPFIKRWTELRMLEIEGVKEVKKKIELLEQQKSQLAKTSLSGMLDNPLIAELLPVSLKDNKLLHFLIRRGYIGEDYDSYVNNCRKVSLDSGDMNFVLSIKSRTPLSPDYSLKRVENILDRLQVVDLEEDAARNYDLLNYMLRINLPDKDKPQYEFFSRKVLTDDKLRSFIRSFAKWASESPSWKPFFDEFSNNYDYGWELIRLLAIEWKDMVSYILGKKGYPTDYDTFDILFSEFDGGVPYASRLRYDGNLGVLCLDIHKDDRDRILWEVLWGCRTDFIKEQNVDGVLGNYLSDNSQLLKNIDINRGRNYYHLKSMLKKMDVKFNSIKVDVIDKDMLDVIFDGCYYHLNNSTLNVLFLHKNPDLLKRLKRQPYSAVLDLGDMNLLDYVYENFEEFIERCILTQKEPSDRPENIVDMLLRLEKNTKLQKELIEKEVFQLERIDDCAGEEVRADPKTWQSIWDALLKRDVVAVSWENTLSYWKVYHFSEQLKKYMTEHAEILARNDFSVENETFIKEFINAGFEMSVLHALLPVLQLKEFDLSISSLDERVLQAMIDCRYFAFTAETFKEVGKVDEATGTSDLRLEFVLNNQAEFMQIKNEVVIEQNLFEQLILSNQFQKQYEEELFAEYGKRYMTSKLATQMKVLELPVTKEIFESAWNLISSKGDREELLLEYCKLLNADELEEYFDKLGGVYKGLAQRNRAREVRIPKTDKTLVLAEYLRKIGYITSFKEDTRKSGTETHHELKLRVKRIE